jgi:hypothetical protein
MAPVCCDPVCGSGWRLFSIQTDVPMSDGGLRRPLERARVRIEDRRQIGFPTDALLDALLTWDHHRHGWLWRAVDHILRIEGAESTSVVVEARRQASGDPERMVFDVQHVAAAIIHYCWREHIPVPRSARKEVKLTAEGAVLLLSHSIAR